MPFSLFLALKYLKPKRSIISVISVISVLGVILGAAILIIVLSVMQGFDDMWRDRILGFNAHLTVQSYDPSENSVALAQRVERYPGIRGASPYVQGLVFIQHNDRTFTPFIRGIEPGREERVSLIATNIVAGAFELDDESALIGVDLAREMALGIGDRLVVYSPRTLLAKDEIQLPEELTVAGIFELGMWEYDMGFLLVHIETARDLLGIETGAQGVRVMTDDPFKALETAEALRNGLGPGYGISTWMELNEQLFGVLQVEKKLMLFLLVFISLVAAFGVTNTLITTVFQKTREIGLLKAVGFSTPSVTAVFLWQGFIQGLFGTLLGTGTGLLVTHYRNTILNWLSTVLKQDLFPKKFYRLSEIPAHTTVQDVVTVALIVLIMCTVAGLIPAWRAARQDPVQAIRHE